MERERERERRRERKRERGREREGERGRERSKDQRLPSEVYPPLLLSLKTYHALPLGLDHDSTGNVLMLVFWREKILKYVKIISFSKFSSKRWRFRSTSIVKLFPLITGELPTK